MMQMQRQQMRAGPRQAFRPAIAARVSRRTAVKVNAEKVLIVNTKGGGHAFIGLYLAQELLKKKHEVTILNDGDKVKNSTG